MTPAFAESPSHKISVHIGDFAVPAKLASTNLGIPLIDFTFEPSVFFTSLLSFTWVKFIAMSITPNPDFIAIFSTNFSLTSQLDPNFGIGVFMKSLV